MRRGKGLVCYGNTPMKRFIAAFCLIAPLLLGARVAAGAESPQGLVQETSERMLTTLKAERGAIEKNPDRLYQLVREIVLPHFDFEQMSRLVLGKHWRRLTPEQRERFVQEFQALLIRTYGTALNEYRDQKIEYLPMREGSDPKETTVRTEVQRPGAPPIPIDYSMLLENDRWKVYDVVIEGVSLVTNYRTSFSNEINQGGFDQLIKKLQERNQQAATT